MKAMRDQAEKERTEVLERFQAVKGRLESEQSMIVGFLEKEGKIYTQIKIDEITNLGAVKIRLRSLFAAIEKQETQEVRHG